MMGHVIRSDLAINACYRLKEKKNYVYRPITKGMVERDVEIRLCEDCYLD